MKVYKPKLIDVQTRYGESLLDYNTDKVMHEMSQRQYQKMVFDDLQAVKRRPCDAPMATYNEKTMIEKLKEFFRR